MSTKGLKFMGVPPSRLKFRPFVAGIGFIVAWLLGVIIFNQSWETMSFGISLPFLVLWPLLWGRSRLTIFRYLRRTLPFFILGLSFALLPLYSRTHFDLGIGLILIVSFFVTLYPLVLIFPLLAYWLQTRLAPESEFWIGVLMAIPTAAWLYGVATVAPLISPL